MASEVQLHRIQGFVDRLITGGFNRVNHVSADGTLAENSDNVIATQKAVKTYADAVQTYTDGLNTAMDARVDALEAWDTLMSLYLGLPFLRCLWPMGAVTWDGRPIGFGNAHILSVTSAPIFGFDGLVPYCHFDGSDDNAYYADDPNYSITGTEAFIETPGLTVGCWVNCDTFPSAGAWMGLVSKFLATGNQRSYRVYVDSTGAATFQISVDGSAATSSGGSAALTTTQWSLVIGRFVPSTKLEIFVDGVWVTNTTSIPAAIYDSTAKLFWGAWADGAAARLDGKESMCFVCAGALSDAICTNLWTQGKALYGR